MIKQWSLQIFNSVGVNTKSTILVQQRRLLLVVVVVVVAAVVVVVGPGEPLTAGAGHHVHLLSRDATCPQIGWGGTGNLNYKIKFKNISLPTSDYRKLYSEPGPRWARQSWQMFQNICPGSSLEFCQKTSWLFRFFPCLLKKCYTEDSRKFHNLYLWRTFS